MSDSKKIDTPSEIHSILQKSKNNTLKWWLWKSGPSTEDKSPLFVSLKRYDQLKGIAELRPISNKQMHFTSNDQLFLGNEDFKVAFKMKTKEVDNSFITFRVPENLNRFEGNLLENVSLLEIDNESKSEKLRLTPRKSANGELVGVSWNGKDDFFQLHDISTGGMAIIANDPGEFSKSDVIEIFEINEKSLSKKIIGKVVSIRAVQTGSISLIKIGIQFD